MGDFNVDMIKKSTQSKKLLSCLADFGFTLNNSSPTRITTSSATCIDLIFTNTIISHKINNISCITCSFSDHSCLSFTIKKKRNVIINNSITVEYLHSSKHLSFMDCLLNSQITGSSSSMVLNSLSLAMAYAFQTNSSTKVVKELDKGVPWFSPYIQAACNHKDQLHKLALTTNINNKGKALVRYRKQRNHCNHLLISAKRQFFQTKVENGLSSDPRKSWKLIKPLPTW